MKIPRQNRVTPFGEIIAISERGTFMGNRGNLHDDKGNIQRHWRGKRWIVCALEFRGRKRKVMTPGEYTELFFLDEATALAAGHRPCGECRHARFSAFCNAWKLANLEADGGIKPTASLIDNQLHSERVNPDLSKCVSAASLQDLPDGVFVNIPAWGMHAYLLWKDQLLAWSNGGYQERRPRPANEEVTVITPRSTVAAILAGYLPEVHPSAANPG